ncbi:MAG: hypothetical protein CFE22_12255 [Cytophagaceae bacterium BCCC1]|nr:MAG: hypothetical protein CFE22_12255 [Cytophagaceae bacterium BCCC1]
MGKNDLLREKKLKQFGIIQLIFIIIYVWIIGYIGRKYFRNSEGFNSFLWVFNIFYVIISGIVIFRLRTKRY